jgi:TonB family protein
MTTPRSRIAGATDCARCLLALCLLAAGVPGAHAACPAPTPPVSIPSGATATEKEMAQAGRELQAFDAAVGSYRDCLIGEMTQKQIGKPPEEARAIQEETVRAHTELLTKLHWMADCYNAELKTFRATGGGKKATPARCSGYVTQVTAVAPSPAPSPAASPEFSAPQTVPNGTWSYRVVRSERPEPCRFHGAPECVGVRLEVENHSNRTLECRAQMELSGNNNEGVPHVEMPGIVLPGKLRPLLTTLLPAATTVTSGTASCTEREPFPPLDVPAECRFQVVRPVKVSDYYPAASRRVREEGTVALQFQLAEKEGKPSHIQVIGSSLFERLDAAAMKAAGDIVFATACPGRDFRLQLTFELD